MLGGRPTETPGMILSLVPAAYRSGAARNYGKNDVGPGT
jgi:hypothetical protein